VGSEALVVYGYTPANGNLLSSITQGSINFTFQYDEASRLMLLERSNDVDTDYSYDESNRMVGIAHKKGTVLLEEITYVQDALGRPALRGSLLPTLAPRPFQGQYGSANRLSSVSGQPIEHDENGNMASEGALTYTYDVRDRLVGVSGPALQAAFAYDALGRRISKTVNGSTVRYLYDGLNVVQERIGTGGAVNMLSAGPDTWLARTGPEGTTYFLHDALGSVIAETDATGLVKTRYAYDPFGWTEVGGAASSNPFRYTGREDDGAGLYFYRARYYRPQLQRFVAEDPIRVKSGTPNYYAYVHNSPIHLIDPSGLAVSQPSANPGGGQGESCACDRVLYHYTGTRGVQGILDTERVDASPPGTYLSVNSAGRHEEGAYDLEERKWYNGSSNTANVFFTDVPPGDMTPDLAQELGIRSTRHVVAMSESQIRNQGIPLYQNPSHPNIYNAVAPCVRFP
jgi:RHS repeat-associated protein